MTIGFSNQMLHSGPSVLEYKIAEKDDKHSWIFAICCEFVIHEKFTKLSEIFTMV